MALLDSRDDLIRQKVRGCCAATVPVLISDGGQTLDILYAVDPNIVASYRTRLLQSPPPQPSLDTWNAYAGRLLEVAAVSGRVDGAAYASAVVETVSVLEGAEAGDVPPVLERVVEAVLMRVRNGECDCERPYRC
jgi:hypothetical protein